MGVLEGVGSGEGVAVELNGLLPVGDKNPDGAVMVPVIVTPPVVVE